MKKSLISCVAFVGFFLSSPALAKLGPVNGKEVKAVSSAAKVCPNVPRGEAKALSVDGEAPGATTFDSLRASRASAARSRR
jgi:hypothetical protein